MKSTRSARPIGHLLVAATAMIFTAAGGEALAQVVRIPPPPPAAALRPAQTPAPSPAQTAPPPAKTETTIPEDTEVRVRLDERLSSASNVEGDEFGITTDEPIQLPDGTVIPAGFHGRGEVTEAHKKGMLGKAGELHIRLDFVRIGATRVPLRADKGGQGKSGVGTTVVLTVLITPLFLMHHGAEIVYPRGQKITAFVDQDTRLQLPVPAPPEAY